MTNKQVALTSAVTVWRTRVQASGEWEQAQASVRLLRAHGEEVTQLAEQLLEWLEQGEEQGR